jgi:hypothetical protein
VTGKDYRDRAIVGVYGTHLSDFVPTFHETAEKK